MDLSLVGRGFLVMLVGMGTVFFFLIVLVFAMDYSAKVLAWLNRFLPEETNEDKKLPKKNAQNGDAAIAIAVACAVAKSRKV